MSKNIRFPILAILTCVGLLACQTHTAPRLYYNSRNDSEILHKFPHNCLQSKVSNSEIENIDRHFDGKDLEWKTFKAILSPGDELWQWSGDSVVPNHHSDVRDSGKAGYCIMRNNKVIAIFYCYFVSVI